MPQDYPSPDLVPKESVEEVLAGLALSDPTRFKSFFQHLRSAFPREAAVAALRHIAEHGLDPAGQQVMLWLVSTSYFELLLDSEALPMEVGIRAAKLLKNADPRFFLNFSKITADVGGKNYEHLLGPALVLLDAMGDYSVLLPWIRSLTAHPSKHIRSKAAKSLCKLRPNTKVILRQLQSEDPRVRANAVEAIWHVESEDALLILQEAMSDPHHRVVLNAVVGLYYQNPDASFSMLLKITKHPSVMFRAAAVWALGFIRDSRSLDVLDVMAKDPSPMIRRKAEDMLSSLRGPERASEKAKRDAPAAIPSTTNMPATDHGDYRSQWFAAR